MWKQTRRSPKQHSIETSWSYHPCKRLAEYLAPPDRPWTVVDVSKPVTPHPSVASLLVTRYIEGDDPYPTHRATRWNAPSTSVNPRGEELGRYAAPPSGGPRVPDRPPNAAHGGPAPRKCDRSRH